MRRRRNPRRAYDEQGREIAPPTVGDARAQGETTAWVWCHDCRHEATISTDRYPVFSLPWPAHRRDEGHEGVLRPPCGSDWVSICDIYLVPFAPRSFDVWTLDKVAELVEEARSINPDLKAFAFINRADPRGSENAEAAEMLKSKPAFTFIPTTLGTRKAFGAAAATGLGVVELRPLDPKAAEEIQALYGYLFDTRE